MLVFVLCSGLSCSGQPVNVGVAFVGSGSGDCSTSGRTRVGTVVIVNVVVVVCAAGVVVVVVVEVDDAGGGWVVVVVVD